jgi:uncharacterized protein
VPLGLHKTGSSLNQVNGWMKISISDIKKSAGLSLVFDFKDEFKIESLALVSPLEAHLKLTNVGSSNILLQGSLEAEVAQICSRCAEGYSQKLRVELCEEFVPEGDSRLNADNKDLSLEDLNIFSLEEEFIDLTEVIRQNLISALPLQPLCRKDCRGLCPQCGVNLNVAPCSCKTMVKDSCWQPLKKLKKQEV